MREKNKNTLTFVLLVRRISARRALEQSNGAMFLNRKLIVQLSTSRFRPQPKEPTNHSLTDGNGNHQKPLPISAQTSYPEINYEMISKKTNNEYRPSSPTEHHKLNQNKPNKNGKILSRIV